MSTTLQNSPNYHSILKTDYHPIPSPFPPFNQNTNPPLNPLRHTKHFNSVRKNPRIQMEPSQNNRKMGWSDTSAFEAWQDDEEMVFES